MPWLAGQFGINYTHKVSNLTRLHLVKLHTLLMQLIPNCTANHGITYTHSFLAKIYGIFFSNPVS